MGSILLCGMRSRLDSSRGMRCDLLIILFLVYEFGKSGF